MSTTMMRHARQIRRALDAEDESIRPKLAVVPDIDEAANPREIRPAEIRTAIAYLKAHRRRDLLFSPGIFGDPAWEMMLDLFVAEGETRPVTMDSVCLAVGVPASTAWRKFATLEREGWVTRAPDPEDGRRTRIELTSSGIQRIRQWLSLFDNCTVLEGR